MVGDEAVDVSLVVSVASISCSAGTFSPAPSFIALSTAIRPISWVCCVAVTSKTPFFSASSAAVSPSKPASQTFCDGPPP